VAKVNGQPIAKDALLVEAQRMQKQFSARMGQQVPPTEAFYRKVLDGMIAQRLLLAEAQAQGISVTDAELSAQLDPVRKRMGEENFKKALANDHLTEESFRAEMRKNAVVDKLLNTKVASAVTVTDQDLKSFYDNNQAQFKRPERAHVRHILVAVDPKATAEDKQKAKQKADALLARVKKGEDFATVAQESDDQMSKGRGGDLGWVTTGGVVEPFEKAAFALKPNEISPVVESRFGYHIIQLLERKPADTAPFDEVKERLGAFLKERKTGEAIQAHINSLRKQAEVETYL
jgi:peptidyl-prolyl cis-trans isomerase C